VARLLGFKIRITSTVGESTQVRICIPPASVAAQSEPSVEPEPNAPIESGGPVGRILLVEDNDGVRLATQLFLQLEGFEIRCASSFTEAMQLVSSLRPGDLIITDFHLDSAHSGLDVLAQARAMSRAEVPGIILSGDLPSVIRGITAPIPAVRFLGKPVDTDALLEAIRDLSGKSSY
jgi:DNA-binding NtrC family response regulator